MDTLLQYLKSKTVLFGLLIAIASWAQTLVVNAPLSPEITGFLGTAVGAVVIWLRSVTTKPLSEK